MTRLLIAVVLASVFLVGSALMAQNRAPYFTVGEIEVKDEAAYKAWLPEAWPHQDRERRQIISALRSTTLFPARNRLTSEIGPGRVDYVPPERLSPTPRGPSLLGGEA